MDVQTIPHILQYIRITNNTPLVLARSFLVLIRLESATPARSIILYELYGNTHVKDDADVGTKTMTEGIC